MQDRDRCIVAGMDDYMGKPYKIETLQNLLCKWLGSIIDDDNLSFSPRTSKDLDIIYDKENSLQNRTTVHDLRNTLTGVIGGVELAISSCEDPVKCERNLQIALKAAQRSLYLIQKL